MMAFYSVCFDRFSISFYQIDFYLGQLEMQEHFDMRIFYNCTLKYV